MFIQVRGGDFGGNFEADWEKSSGVDGCQEVCEYKAWGVDHLIPRIFDAIKYDETKNLKTPPLRKKSGKEKWEERESRKRKAF
jgi:hypothetical protein